MRIHTLGRIQLKIHHEETQTGGLVTSPCRFDGDTDTGKVGNILLGINRLRSVGRRIRWLKDPGADAVSIGFDQPDLVGLFLAQVRQVPHHQRDGIPVPIQEDGAGQILILAGDGKRLSFWVGEHGQRKLIGLELLQEAGLLKSNLSHLQKREKIHEEQQCKCRTHRQLTE